MPLVATGLEMVSIERLRRALARRGERLLERLFTAAEIAHADARSDPVPALAARLGAKLALRRALRGRDSSALRLREIEVVFEGGGAPRVRLWGRTADLCQGLAISLSLTHDGGVALASVHVERRGPAKAGRLG